MSRLPVADALRIHDAIHSNTSSVTLSCNGATLPVFVSANDCRRADTPKGMFTVAAKFMAQNLKKPSAAAARAKAGASITHILPLRADGSHTSTGWGMIENGQLIRTCSALENGAPPPEQMPAPDGSTFLQCPYGEKDEAKAVGALWDPFAKQWYVAPGRSLAPFHRWLSPPTPAKSASSAAAEVDDEVEVAGERTWAEKDAALRKHAVVVDEASDDDGATPSSKRVKKGAEDVDALIIGGGIMGTTVAVMLKLLQPQWKVRLVEQLDRVGAESSNEWHNAGTGHAALCEANYTPVNPNTGQVDISKARIVNQKFNVSLSFWSWLVEKGLLPDGAFIQPAPHILFTHGDRGVAWLRERVEKLKPLPSFAATEYSEDYDTIKEWVGLLCSGRPRDGGEVIACSRHPDGTEVNYGLLTRMLAQTFTEMGGSLQLLSRVTALQQQDDSRWLVAIKKDDLTGTNSVVRARYVFAGAGGGSLRILQRAGIPEIAGYAGMPVSGKFLVCQKPEIIAQNKNKVYGRAAIGAPPMSVPHLDWRTIYGQDCIFFGPFAGFSPTVFKVGGSYFDWISTFNASNVLPTAAMALREMPLVRYLISEVFSSKTAQLEALREFVPDAKPEDWTMVWAGQRIQIVKPDGTGRGSLQFGTEVVSSKDGTIVGLLGASPGASISPMVAIEVLQRFNAYAARPWEAALKRMIPAYGRDINETDGLYEQVMDKAKRVLLQGEVSGHRTARTNANHLFDRLDTSRKGKLTVRDLKKVLTLEEQQLNELFDKLDVDASGEISREKFDAGFATFLTSQVRQLKRALTMAPASCPVEVHGKKK